MSDPETTPAPVSTVAHGQAARRWLGTPAARVAMLIALFLALQVPRQMIGGLIQERQDRQHEALTFFRRGWGPEQAITGPMLLVPYTRGGPGNAARQWAWLPASHLDVAATLQPAVRRRGLFRATIYTAAVTLNGTMTIPPLALPDDPAAKIDWRDAEIGIAVGDTRGLAEHTTLNWNNGAVALRATGRDRCGFALLLAPAGLQAAPAADSPLDFTSTLTLRGTQSFRLVPEAGRIHMTIASPWRTPAFGGTTLPVDYRIGASGFAASWEAAGDPATSGWQLAQDCGTIGDATWLQPDAWMGVTLQEAVPTYLIVDRATKYCAFFLALAYLTLFLFEMVCRQPIHPVQYGMIGLSLSLFPLLLISIAEPLGFTVAYAISAAAVMLQAALYALSVLGRRRLAVLFAVVLTGYFAFLYVVLSLDSYALLCGSVGLFVVLSVLMAATRQVNWSTPQARA